VRRDPVARPDDTDPWVQVLVGRHGEIYPHGRDLLAVEVYDGRIALRVAEVLNGSLPWQRGEAFFCYVFPVNQLVTVADIIQPPKVRHLSPAARDRLAQVGQETQFGTACCGTQARS
jgi:hypothetical protein